MASSSEAALHRRDSEQGPRREPPLRLGPQVRPAIRQHEQYILTRSGQSRRRFANTVSDDARPVSRTSRYTFYEWRWQLWGRSDIRST